MIATDAKSTVYPVGSLAAVAATATLPPAPPLFWMTTGRFQSAPSCSARRLAATSAPPPATKGTIMRTGLDGKPCTGPFDEPKTGSVEGGCAEALTAQATRLSDSN